MSYAKTKDVLGTVNRGDVAESGLCTLCRADCTGKCETYLSGMLGREMLYPRDFGMVTAGSSQQVGPELSYQGLRINGYLYGSSGLREGLTHSADDCIFPNVSIETEFGAQQKTKSRVPFMTGALGSTFIAAKYWESFAIGAALSGFPIVIGENVVGIDKEAVIENGKIIKAPELERRIDTYLRYYDGYGAILVQMNVEDTRNGVAEFLIEKYGNKVIIELKWGQGAKCIGGEIQVNDIEYAVFLKKRGYIVDPDPESIQAKEAFESGALKAFSRHSRLGYTDLATAEEVRDAFMKSVAHLREIGFQRITLKTGSYGMEALAMAIKFASEAKLDLLTIDGSGGGTGMSPWNMMEHWGVPSLLLHAKAYEYASLLKRQGVKVVDLAFAGGIAREDQIFKALALGAPFVKSVCMGRAMMIPGFLGANIEGVIHPERREKVSGNWSQLPPSVTGIGMKAEEIFAGYYDIQEKIGIDAMKEIPYGAIAITTLVDKLGCGLQQLMAGARKFSVSEISRDDLFSVTRDVEKETGISFVTHAQDEQAKQILYW